MTPSERLQMRQAFKYRANIAIAVLALYWTALFVCTHVPVSGLILVENVSDKTLHLIAYAGLAFLMLGASCAAGGQLTLALCIGVLFVLIGYGAVDELTQHLVGRHCDFYDWVADTIGSLVGIAMFLANSAAIVALRRCRTPQPPAS